MKCPSCGSNSVILDNQRGERICTRCGFVLLEKEMDRRPEWRSEPGEEKGRADVASVSDITQHDYGLGTEMGKSRDLSPAWKSKLRRLKKWHRRARASSYHDKSLRKALINLDKFCEDLDLPRGVKAEVSVLFRKAKDQEITPGRNTWTVLASLLFIVARIRGIPRTEDEVAGALMTRANLEEKEAFRGIRRTRKILANELGLEIPRPKPKEYIDRFSTELGLSESGQTEAHEICKSFPEKFKSRKASFLAAAAVVYNASRKLEEGVRIRELADTLNVGVSSVSETGKRIRELSNLFEE